MRIDAAYGGRGKCDMERNVNENLVIISMQYTIVYR